MTIQMLRLMRNALFAIALIAPGIQAAEGKGPRKTLTIGISQFPASFHPLIESMLAKSYILAMTLRPLTIYDAKWKLVCLLCTQLPTFENGLAKKVELGKGKTGVELTYTIHPKATWGDGTPVTTKDFIFTWKVGKHPLSAVGAVELFRRILKIVPNGPKSFTLTYDRVTFNYNEMSGLMPLPAHLEAGPFKRPRDYKDLTTYNTNPTNSGLYFGPYRISQLVRGAYVVLERNPTWYGKKPFFQRIVVQVIPNGASLEANLLAGGIDYIAGELGVTVDQALSMQQRFGSQFKFVYKPGLIYEHIDLNLKHVALRDIRVRQALIYAIDRQKISKALYAGRQKVADSMIHPLDPHFAKGIKTYRYNPRKAAALLDAAGWKLKGRWRHKDGRRLRITIMTTARDRARELVEQILQSYWRDIGIDARIRNQQARVFFGVTVSERKFPAMAMFAWLSAPGSVPRSTLHSSMIPSKENNFRGQNYTGFVDKEMDKLIDQAEVALDAEKRRRIFRRIQEIYVTKLPVIPLYYRAAPFVLPKWLHGVVPTGHQYSSTNWVEHWYAK